MTGEYESWRRPSVAEESLVRRSRRQRLIFGILFLLLAALLAWMIFGNL